MTLQLNQTVSPSLGLTQDHDFAGSCLPRTMELATLHQAILKPCLNKFPEAWPFHDRVLALLVPNFAADIQRFHEAKGKPLGEIKSAKALQVLDADFLKELGQIVETIRAGEVPLISPQRYTYSLSGRVIPERGAVNLPLPVKVVASSGGLLPGWEVVVSVVNSQLSATLTTPEAVEDLQDMRERIEDVARFCVDSLGFLLACGYDLELTQVVALDPMKHEVFGVFAEGVTEKREYSAKEVYDRFLTILGVSPNKQQPLRRALVDFREAIRSHEDTPFFCFRAIEDLRQFFVPLVDDDVKKSWSEMAMQLQIPKETVDYVWNTLRVTAMSVRHGAGTRSDGEVRRKMLRVTWFIIDLFVSLNVQRD